VALDNGLLVETRVLLVDGILIAATLGSLVCFVAAQRSGGWWTLVGAGLLAGLATGTKLTGLVAPGLILLCLAVGLGVVTAPFGNRARQGLVVVGAALLVYVAGWVAHWLLLPNAGPGDAFYPTTGRIVADLMAPQREMLSANMSLAATHPDASAPWTWPLMKVVPYFWQGDSASIYMMGNPVVWWGTGLVFFSLLIQMVVMRPLGVAPPAA
jgi:dolichyl-phosphate-mannose--protein O-mannosyl transferase